MVHVHGTRRSSPGSATLARPDVHANVWPLTNSGGYTPETFLGRSRSISIVSGGWIANASAEHTAAASAASAATQIARTVAAIIMEQPNLVQTAAWNSWSATATASIACRVSPGRSGSESTSAQTRSATGQSAGLSEASAGWRGIGTG